MNDMNLGLPDSIIGEKGRAISQTFNNLPPDQQQSYISQQIMAGNIDYLSALALKGQYDRLKGAAQQPQMPQQTVVQGMQAALAAGNPSAAPVPAPNALLASPPQNQMLGPMQGQGIAQPMQQPQVTDVQPGGIPTVPAPVMDNADFNMARGGVVAFAGGGTPDFYVDSEGNVRTGPRGSGVATIPQERLLNSDEMARKFADIADDTKGKPGGKPGFGTKLTEGLPESLRNILNRPVGTGGGLPSLAQVGSAGRALYVPALAGKTLFEGAGALGDLYTAARGEEVEPEYSADDARRMFGLKEVGEEGYKAPETQGQFFFTDPQFWRDYGMGLAGTAADVFSLGMFQPSKKEAPAEAPPKDEDKFQVAPALPPEITRQPAAPARTAPGIALPPIDEKQIRGAYQPMIDLLSEKTKTPPKSAEAFSADYKKRLEAAGIGGAGKRRQQEITNELTNMPNERRRQMWLNAAAGFFEAAKETAQGKSLGASWATGAATGLQGYAAASKELKAREDRLRDAKANLDLAEEAVQMRILDRGDADYKEAKAEYDAARNSLAQIETSGNRDVIAARQKREADMVQMRGQDIQLQIAQIQAASKGSPLEEALAPWYQAYTYYTTVERNPLKAEQAYRQILQLAKTDPRILAITAGIPPVPPKDGKGGAGIQVVAVKPEPQG